MSLLYTEYAPSYRSYLIPVQNEEKIEVIAVHDIMNNPPEDLAKNFVEINGDYFVHETIMEFDDFDLHLKQRKSKPFYIPQPEELLKYKDETYFEVNEQYRALLSYVTRHVFDGDEFAAELVCELKISATLSLWTRP